MCALNGSTLSDRCCFYRIQIQWDDNTNAEIHFWFSADLVRIYCKISTFIPITLRSAAAIKVQTKANVYEYITVAVKQYWFWRTRKNTTNDNTDRRIDFVLYIKIRNFCGTQSFFASQSGIDTSKLISLIKRNNNKGMSAWYSVERNLVMLNVILILAAIFTQNIQENKFFIRHFGQILCVSEVLYHFSG